MKPSWPVAPTPPQRSRRWSRAEAIALYSVLALIVVLTITGWLPPISGGEWVRHP